MDTGDWTVDDQTFRYQKTIVPNAEADFTDMPTVLKVSGDPESENWHEEVLAFLYRLKGQWRIDGLESGRFPFLVGAE